MTGQTKKLVELLQERLVIVGRISVAQAEHLKLQQIIGGQSFGHMFGEVEESQKATEAAAQKLRDSEQLIFDIEDELRVLDEQIEQIQAEGTE